MNIVKKKLGENGEVVIPPEYLQAPEIEVGDTVILRIEDGEIRVFTSQLAIRKA